jgi:hypothetical protein
MKYFEGSSDTHMPVFDTSMTMWRTPHRYVIPAVMPTWPVGVNFPALLTPLVTIWINRFESSIAMLQAGVQTATATVTLTGLCQRCNDCITGNRYHSSSSSSSSSNSNNS